MYGAMLGDIIGAPYEFDRGEKRKDFGPLFVSRALKSDSSRYTDDSLLTIAICDGLLKVKGKNMSDKDIKKELTKTLFDWVKRPEYRHIYREYGVAFGKYLMSSDPKPYGSYGNGSAMRVSSAGYLFDTLEETRRYARLTAEITHNHVEGVRGAEAVASVIFLARNGATKEEIRKYVVDNFASNDPKALNYNYNLQRTVDEIRPGYRHVETCPECIPEAITCFLEADSYEDAIRTAISIGGDTDTIGCIVGSMAEAFYGVPKHLVDSCKTYITPEMQAVTDKFYTTVAKLDTVKETDFAEAALSPVKYAERVNKYGDMTNEDLLGALENQLKSDKLSERERDYAEFMKKALSAGYPASDVEALWLAKNTLEELPENASQAMIEARDNAKNIIEDVISNKKDGVPSKLTVKDRTDNIRKVKTALEVFAKTGDGVIGLDKANQRILTDIKINERIDAPLSPGDRIRMAKTVREFYEILETTDPPFMRSSSEFRDMKAALKTFVNTTENSNPENEIDKQKYEADKNKLKTCVLKYINYKSEQLNKGRKRSEVECLRVSAAESLYDRLKKEDYIRHAEQPKNTKILDMLNRAKKVIVLKDDGNGVKAAAALMAYKLLSDEGKEVTYQLLLSNYENLCNNNTFKTTVSKFKTNQLQDVIENGTFEKTYTQVATREQEIADQIRREREKREAAEKRKKEKGKQSKPADANKTADKKTDKKTDKTADKSTDKTNVKTGTTNNANTKKEVIKK